MGLPIRTLIRAISGGGLSPDGVTALLFGGGEQGIAVPDLTPGNGYMFQDSAGTIPVTAYEQPVGRILDRSGRGNHIIQATSTKRPTLSARYNLLTQTENFTNTTSWPRTAAISVTGDAIAAPNGTLTADLIASTSATTAFLYSQSLAITSGAILRGVVHVKQGSANADTRLRVMDGAQSVATFFSASASWSGGVPTFTASTGTIVSQNDVGNGWYRIVFNTIATTTSTASLLIYPSNGNQIHSVYCWGADLRRTIDTIGQPAYQRVGASNDYDTAGFYPYLAFDGTDDSMATAASVDFSGTDKMTVFHGVTKLSDAATGVAFEFSTSYTANNGAFALFAPGTGGADRYRSNSTGTLPSSSGPGALSTYNAPNSAVITQDMAIAADRNILSINRTSFTSADDQGTGNFGNYTLFLGARNNSSIFFNGRMYPFFIRGAATDATTIAQVEQYIRARMPVSF